jgi:hypothetical protein
MSKLTTPRVSSSLAAPTGFKDFMIFSVIQLAGERRQIARH